LVTVQNVQYLTNTISHQLHTCTENYVRCHHLHYSN